MISISRTGITILRYLAIILAISGVIDMCLKVYVPSLVFGAVCLCLGIALFLLTYATRSIDRKRWGVD